MKKIFAIALALVMVLSMASAFAYCDVIDWSTTTNCGTGSVEVVPYVLGNKAGGYNTFVQSDCAAAVNNEEIYFAIKVTVAENPNAEWWKNAELKLSYAEGLYTDLAKYVQGSVPQVLVTDVSNWWLNKNAGSPANLYDNLVAAGNGELKAGTYYVTTGAKISDSFKAINNLFAAFVRDAGEGVEVCAKIESSAKADGVEIEINGAKVKVTGGTDGNYEIKVDGVRFVFEQTGKFLFAEVGGNHYYSFCDGKFFGDAGRTAEAACANKDDYKAITDAMAAINITWGQKITYATAKAKLGWSVKVSDCATWNDEALSIVNAECQVLSIPKTGDASVLAWLF